MSLPPFAPCLESALISKTSWAPSKFWEMILEWRLISRPSIMQNLPAKELNIVGAWRRANIVGHRFHKKRQEQLYSTCRKMLRPCDGNNKRACDINSKTCASIHLYLLLSRASKPYSARFANTTSRSTKQKHSARTEITVYANRMPLETISQPSVCIGFWPGLCIVALYC